VRSDGLPHLGRVWPCLTPGYQVGVLNLVAGGGGLMKARGVLVSLLVFVLLVLGTPALAQPPSPTRMAALGDSITRAADVCCWYGDHPSDSWSTGGNLVDGVSSHYERILTASPSIYGNHWNDAVSGAKMSDGSRQATQAVSQGAQYVTILLGANDVCTSSPSTMTPVDQFRSQFQNTIETLESGLPQGAHIFVASIPNVYQLWQILHTDSLARFTWSTFGICQSMLSPYRTEAARQRVLAREQAFNDVLEQVCSSFSDCRFDGYAVFGFQFTKHMVSKLDYFHPSLDGQAALASLTWSKSWWGTP
jgi:lysophospholipase L1-like esterase